MEKREWIDAHGATQVDPIVEHFNVFGTILGAAGGDYFTERNRTEQNGTDQNRGLKHGMD